MALACGRDVLPDVRLPRKRREELMPRKKYNREEDRLRPLVIKELEKRGFVVKRIENSICGDSGSDVPDLWAFSERHRWGGWIEIKRPTGILSPGQGIFKGLCEVTGVNHIVIRSVDEAKNFWLTQTTTVCYI